MCSWYLAEFFSGGSDAETLQGLHYLLLKLGAVFVWKYKYKIVSGVTAILVNGMLL